MDVTATEIPDVLILTPRRFADARGFFSETWSARAMAAVGLDVAFVQDNHSRSTQAGTVRGLHYQRPPHAQGKLVRVARGRIRDVAVDVRVGSPSYGRWVAAELSAENGAQLWAPRGFLHGFVTLEPDTDVIYKVDDFYSADCDGAVRFDDPDLAIDWGVDPQAATLSDKDAAAPAFASFRSPFAFAHP
ncbi:dTDP-4-dehydrorhamnose 3,5-epimerase [Rubrimonas cliftonensis]|uniref:dTDP-4-dehydrorhamnose 3,5-epimerase n=1 Tax=Rubrimonas cliftonensis TaxID=89524 RepID=A0A1H4CTR4_9RHOB|nr:dTDP-4-dehydrorhamnose 3,5-epimerase [Rubrimonas cliftonensis]SEA63708.1 dTDP-4-dehydrorhamnose 3,5-epimerase [Rubrimonas cliftonensis]